MSESDSASEEFSTAGELRSFIENNLNAKNKDVYPHAGLVDSPDTLEFMNFMESCYDGSHPKMPYKFSETKLGTQVRRASATRTATNAVDEGNISQMKYISGQQSYKSDSSGLHTLMQLRDMLGQDAYIQYLFGHMGNGKTDFAILQAEIARKEHNADIGTNIKSLDQKDHYLYNYGDLLQWLADGEEVGSIDEIAELDINAGNKLFLFDEASSHASGYSDDAYETQKKLGTLTKKIRKVGGSMIIIGHTGKDVHPDIRRITNDCVHKTGKKNATFYHSVEEGKGRGKKFSIGSIPQTNWKSYDTNEITSWEWTDVPSTVYDETAEGVVEKKKEQSTEQRNIEMVKAWLTGEHPELDTNEKGKITQEMLGEHYNLTKQRVSQIIGDMSKDPSNFSVGGGA